MKPKYLYNWVIIICLAAATCQSIFAKSLILEDTLVAKNEIIFEEILGGDVSILSTHFTENETLLLLLDRVIRRSIPVNEIEELSDVVNLVEISLADQSILAEYYAAAPDDETEVDLKHLVYDPASGQYLIYDALSQSMLAYSFLEPEARVIEVEKVRLVEVPVELPPEPVVEEVVPEEVIEEVPEEAAEEVAEIEEEIEPAVEEVSEIVDEQAEELSVVVEDAAAETQPTEEMEEVVEEISEAVEDTTEAQPEEVEAEMEITEETQEAIEETEEMLEEVAESPNAIEFPQPTTKWIEETYTDEEIIYINRYFGTPLASYALEAFSEGEIKSLANNDAGQVIALFMDTEGVLKQFGLSVSGDSIALSELKTFPEYLTGIVTMATDPVSTHVLYSLDGQSVISEYTADGVLIKRHENAMLRGAMNMQFIEIADETGAVNDVLLRVLTDSRLVDLDWGRFDQETVRWVPGQYASLQSAIEAANDGDWVLVSPGQYAGGAELNTGSISITSLYAITPAETFVENTVITGGGTSALNLGNAAEASISHLTIEGFETGILSEGTLTVDSLTLTGNGDAIECAGGTAFIQNSTIQNSSRTGILYSDATASLVEYNTITANQQHGIKVVITPYNRVLYRSVFRKNHISENGDSGIYFEDDTIITNREFRIENNFIIDNGVAGIQVYLEQPDPRNRLPEGPRRIEPHFIVNNTLAGNPTGILNGGNFKVINNIIAFSEEVGIVNLRYQSLVIRNLFWENGENAVDSNYNARGNVEEDPLFAEDGSYELNADSPAIGVGIRGNLWNDDSDRSGNTLGANI